MTSESKITGPGTYYLKFAARRITGSGSGSAGTNRAGFDNIWLGWAGTATTYATTSPINPVTTTAITGLKSWNSFQETANKNGGQIYYQLSNSSTSTWQYWTGSAWATAGAINYNTAAVINANIGKFSTSTNRIAFKAYLLSSSTQQVQLDAISIGYTASSTSGYQTSGYLISSAFNMTDNSAVQVITWDQTIPTCTPACNVQLQVSTAPDASGSPGTWTSWYGTTGANTYFTNNYGTIIPNTLNWNRWVRYRAQLTGDGVNTPVLSEVRVNYK